MQRTLCPLVLRVRGWATWRILAIKIKNKRSFQLLKDVRHRYGQTFCLCHHCCPGCLPRERIPPRGVEGEREVGAPALLPSSHPLIVGTCCY